MWWPLIIFELGLILLTTYGICFLIDPYLRKQTRQKGPNDLNTRLNREYISAALMVFLVSAYLHGMLWWYSTTQALPFLAIVIRATVNWFYDYLYLIYIVVESAILLTKSRLTYTHALFADVHGIQSVEDADALIYNYPISATCALLFIVFACYRITTLVRCNWEWIEFTVTDRGIYDSLSQSYHTAYSPTRSQTSSLNDLQDHLRQFLLKPNCTPTESTIATPSPSAEITFSSTSMQTDVAVTQISKSTHDLVIQRVKQLEQQLKEQTVSLKSVSNLYRDQSERLESCSKALEDKTERLDQALIDLKSASKKTPAIQSQRVPGTSQQTLEAQLMKKEAELDSMTAKMAELETARKQSVAKCHELQSMTTRSAETETLRMQREAKCHELDLMTAKMVGVENSRMQLEAKCQKLDSVTSKLAETESLRMQWESKCHELENAAHSTSIITQTKAELPGRLSTQKSHRVQKRSRQPAAGSLLRRYQLVKNEYQPAPPSTINNALSSSESHTFRLAKDQAEQYASQLAQKVSGLETVINELTAAHEGLQKMHAGCDKADKVSNETMSLKLRDAEKRTELANQVIKTVEESLHEETKSGKKLRHQKDKAERKAAVAVKQFKHAEEKTSAAESNAKAVSAALAEAHTKLHDARQNEQQIKAQLEQVTQEARTTIENIKQEAQVAITNASNRSGFVAESALHASHQQSAQLEQQLRHEQAAHQETQRQLRAERETVQSVRQEKDENEIECKFMVKQALDRYNKKRDELVMENATQKREHQEEFDAWTNEKTMYKERIFELEQRVGKDPSAMDTDASPITSTLKKQCKNCEKLGVELGDLKVRAARYSEDLSNERADFAEREAELIGDVDDLRGQIRYGDDELMEAQDKIVELEDEVKENEQRIEELKEGLGVGGMVDPKTMEVAMDRIEALREENFRLEVIVEECKGDWKAEVDEHQTLIEELENMVVRRDREIKELKKRCEKLQKLSAAPDVRRILPVKAPSDRMTE